MALLVACRHRGLAALAVTTLLMTAACGDSTGPDLEDAVMERFDGDGQDGNADEPLASPLQVRILDAEGLPVAGVVVTWDVIAGGGTVTPTSVTDQDGIAEATFTLGPANGEHKATATVPGLTGSPATFTAIAGGIVPPPGPISLVATIPAPEGAVFIHDMFVRDGLAFVFAWNAGVIIYDVGNGMRGGTPAAPEEVGRITTATSGVPCVCAHNGWWFHNPDSGEERYLFVGQEGPGSIGTRSTGDLHVLDISNLAAPVEVAFYHHPDLPDGSGTPRSVGVHNVWMDEENAVLFAAFYNGGVVALDVSGTLSGDLSGRVIASVRPGGASATYTWGVQLANGSLYAIDMLSGLYQLRLDGGELDVVGGGNNSPERFSSDLWVHGSHAYTGTWGARNGMTGNVLKIWSLEGSGAPVAAGSLTIDGISTVSDVEVSPDGTWLLLTGEYGTSAGLHLYDLANPASPDFLARFLVSSESGGLHTGTTATIAGRQYVFAARDPSPVGPALMIFDVTGALP